MSLHTKPEKSINLPRKLDALAYLQKKGEIMPKQMRLRGNIFYANCKVKGVYLQDSLETSDPKLLSPASESPYHRGEKLLQVATSFSCFELLLPTFALP